MTDGIHKLAIGDIDCVVVNEGIGTIDFDRVKQIFDNAPEAELEQAFNAYVEQYGNVGGSMNPLYIKVGERQLLVDVGFGNVINNLAKIGVLPEDITDVIITHFHGDHINGLIDADNNALYPNAQVIVNEAEWNYWMSQDNERSQGARLRFDVYADKIQRTKPDEEIVAGVKVVEAYGHTPGHIGLLIESKGERLLHLVDTAHGLFQHEHPEWSPRFDSQPDVSPITRRKWFKYAADENILTLWYHFPFPGLGYIEHAGDAFKWKPLEG